MFQMLFQQYLPSGNGLLGLNRRLAFLVFFLLVPVTLPKTNVTIAGTSTMNEDVFPIEHGDFPSHPKLLISKAAVDGIVAREMFFRSVSSLKRLRFMKPTITGRNLGQTLSKMTLQGRQKKNHRFSCVFLQPAKVFCRFFPFQVTFLGGCLFPYPTDENVGNLAPFFISNN